MKRSRIDALIDDAIRSLKEHQFHLPPFAFWSLADWQRLGRDSWQIVERKLGWDVTDFGLDRFDEVGLVLLTLRNGSLEHLQRGTGMLYAEKVLFVGVGQVTPMHSHGSKTEDIINRGGGRLAIELHNAAESSGLGTDDVTFLADGTEHTVSAGHIWRLEPGASITLPPGLYHSFWAEDGPVLAGEVSTVNDDEHDNCFLEPIRRFPNIEEDQAAKHPLVSDYARIVPSDK